MIRARPLVFALVLSAAPASRAAGDAPASPEQLAEIQHDQKQAEAQVNAAHGNKLPGEMSPDERRQVIQEQAAAAQKVLDAHQVDAKTYARQTATLSLEQRAQVDAAGKALVEKDRAAKAEAEQKAADEKAREEAEANKPIVIKRGLGEEHPVDIDDTDDTPEDDRAAAEGTASAGEPAADAAATPAGESAPAPAKAAHKGGRTAAHKKKK